MRRGDLVTVVLPGEFGKPRPAVVIQSDDHPGLATILVCPLTSMLIDAPAFRMEVRPAPENGLRLPSQVMLDKLSPPFAPNAVP